MSAHIEEASTFMCAKLRFCLASRSAAWACRNFVLWGSKLAIDKNEVGYVEVMLGILTGVPFAMTI
ncbi:unnamed protein product [Dovyalis caffra]|uniref:Uncharacterized protein n=1 Tax=Dovyalis caffra TaxID=77055 RepID=A0AAV1QWF4_9ROSI|nr:unnamed protein product [Dovyalis caffra]